MPLTSPRRPGVFLDLLADLAECGRFRALNDTAAPAELRGQDIARISAILRYVQEHHMESISLSEAARLAKLSPPAFCRFFKRHLGKTFGDYVNEVRVMQACRELVDTEREVTEIAFDCGYNDLAHFNERFRRFTSRTPREYRRLAAPGLRRP
jgi:AraC-like DNA-binding protein